MPTRGGMLCEWRLIVIDLLDRKRRRTYFHHYIYRSLLLLLFFFSKLKHDLPVKCA